MAQISNCLKIISKLDERDQDALVARLDEIQAHGVPAERAQIQAAIDVMAQLARAAAPVVRSAERPQFNGEDVQINSHNKWSGYQERSAQLGDGMVRWVEDSSTAYITDIQAGPKSRGKAMLECHCQPF